MNERNLDQILVEIADDAEAARDEPPTAKAARSRNPAEDPATVYSVRLPVSRIEQLRVFAETRGVTPSALIRQWVDERLTAEVQGLTPHIDQLQATADQLTELAGQLVRLDQLADPAPGARRVG